MLLTQALTTSLVFPYSSLIMIFAFSYPSVLSGNPSMSTLALGSNSSCKQANFVTDTIPFCRFGPNLRPICKCSVEFCDRKLQQLWSHGFLCSLFLLADCYGLLEFHLLIQQLTLLAHPLLVFHPAIIVDSGLVETHISDHFLFFAALNLRMPKPPAAYVVARSFKYYDPQSFLSDLNKIPWYENILSDDVNEKLLHFNKAFFPGSG